MHNFSYAEYWLFSAFVLLIYSMSLWFRDIISEGTYLGNHTLAVQKGLNMGVALFITSEALFFLAIFWAYFHSALSPTVELGAQWPPMGIEAINAFELPLLNTVILLSSGVTITYSHHSLIQGNRIGALYGGIYTIILALIFTAFQGIEYSVSSFTLSDGAFGSCFYFGTGLILAPIKLNNQSSSFWVTGFCDAECSFSIRVGKDTTRSHNIKVAPIFSIELHAKDIALLEQIKTFFGVGTIISRIRGSKPSVIYSVQSIIPIMEIIIPHFLKYPLLTQKLADFKLFHSAVQIIHQNSKLSLDNLIDILIIKASMGKNLGLSSKLMDLFPSLQEELHKMSRPVVVTQSISSPFWLAGFVSGDGIFYIKPVRYREIISRFTLVFSITQQVRDLNLFHIIQSFLGCGVIENKPNRPNEVNYIVTKLNDITNVIIPFFQSHPIMGVKALDLKDFVKATTLIENKEYQNEKGMKKIICIKKGMNAKRKL